MRQDGAGAGAPESSGKGSLCTWGMPTCVSGGRVGGLMGLREGQGPLLEEECDLVVWLTLRREGKGEANPGANKEVERL